MRGLLRAAACGLIGAVVIIGAGTSRAVAEDDEKSFDQKIRDNFMGALGIKSGNDIDYRERSPLVLPPKIELPPPEANAARAAPNWPVDADQKRRREEANRRRDEVEESRALRPSELNVGPRQRGQEPTRSQDEIEGRPGRPSDLGYTGGILGSIFGNKEETVPFTKEPPRTSLIEPPTGYQTPSPNQPYTAKPERWLPQIPSFFDYGTPVK
ncbi:MAG TPA: hypothetical protein VKB15_04780 [Xanthobacteraceae bacterium]|nr:hypothetical protein [Xanthobacteraceae bacterium]